MADVTLLDLPVLASIDIDNSDVLHIIDISTNLDKQITTGFLAEFILERSNFDLITQSTSPSWEQVKTDNALNQKRWFAETISDRHRFGISDDAKTSFKYFMEVLRTGNTLDELIFNGGIVTINGTTTITGDSNIVGTLDVNSGATELISRFTNTASAIDLDLRGTGSREFTWEVNNASDANMILSNIGAGDFNLSLDGDLMVGSTSITPSRRLVVYNGASDSVIAIQTDDTGTTTTDGLQFAMQQTTNTAFINQRENADMVFLTNGTEEMRLLTGGGLAINTSTLVGSETLRVNGSSYFDDDITLGSAGNKLLFESVAPDIGITGTTTGRLVLSGDSDAASGANIVLRGSTNSGGQSHIEFRQGSTIVGEFGTGGNFTINSTTSPFSQQFHVQGGVSVLGAFGDSADDGFEIAGTSASCFVTPVIGNVKQTSNQLLFDLTNGWQFESNLRVPTLEIFNNSGTFVPKLVTISWGAGETENTVYDRIIAAITWDAAATSRSMGCIGFYGGTEVTKINVNTTGNTVSVYRNSDTALVTINDGSSTPLSVDGAFTLYSNNSF